MLGSPCSACCCGPELEELPERFEIDVSVVLAPEVYVALRYSIRYRQWPTVGSGTTWGFVQSWHVGQISSGTYSLEYVSTASGVALYRYASSGLVLEITCTPSVDGRYSAFLNVVAVRATSQIFGKLSPWNGQLSSVPESAVLGPVGLDSTGNPILGSHTTQLISLAQMQSESVGLTETADTIGAPGANVSPFYYSYKRATNTLRVGSRLVCPSISISGTTGNNAELISSQNPVASLTSGNWPLAIRSQCQFLVGPVFRDMRFNRSEQTQSTPGIHHGLFPGEYGNASFGPEYARAAGWAGGPPLFLSWYPLPGTAVINPNTGQTLVPEQNMFFQEFRREFDISEIRAFYQGTIKTWPAV